VRSPTKALGGAVWLILLLAVLIGPTTALAESVGVLLADGATPTDKDLTQVSVGSGTPLDSLAAMTFPATRGLSATTAVTDCAAGPAGVALGALAASSRAQVANLDAGAAQETLEETLRGLHCADSVVLAADLRLALEVLAEAAQVEGNEGNARFTYEALLAVDPGYSLTSPPGSGYRELFNEVRRSFAGAEATLGLWHTSEAWWDGEAVPARQSAPLGAVPGRHLLQWDAHGVIVGRWVEIEDAEPVAIVLGDAEPDLLRGGLASAGARAAIEPLLTRWAADAGLSAIAVLPSSGSTSGYFVRDGVATAFAASANAVASALSADRLRVTLGGGYVNIQLAHYADLAFAADLRVLGPLHLRVEGDLAISQPIAAVAGFSGEGSAAVLPGLGVGLAVRPTKGIIQPFGALTVGAWFGARDADALTDLDVALAAAPGAPSLSAEDRAILEARHPVDFRGFLDGGVDLIPGGGLLVVRVSGGVGLGIAMTPEAPFGFQMRVGASAGLRFGANRRKAKVQ